MRPRAARGFSLVEVVLAIGLVGFCVVVIIGLLSTLMNSSRESAFETRAAQIAAQIASDLKADPARDTNQTTGATPLQGLLVTVPNSLQVPLLPAALITNTVYYTSEGTPAEAGSGQAIFRADVIITPLILETPVGGSPSRKASQLCVEIRPANQPAARPISFYSRLTPQLSTP